MGAPRPPPKDDYVDSDSDSESDAESSCSVTQTQLAVTDGPIEADDAANPLVSRIGGRVAWLPTPSIPPPSVAECAHCHQQMELLLQIFAPLDDSAYDRIVLVWGCARAACQKLGTGCVKAIRVLSYNARWATKLEKKRLRQEQRAAEKKRLEEERNVREKELESRKKVNPFSAASSGAGNAFAAGGGLGGALFGGNGTTADQINPFAAPSKSEGASDAQGNEQDEQHGSDKDEDEEDDEDEMAEELAIKASLETSQTSWKQQDWTKEAPSYEPAYYLSTFAEPSSAARVQDEQKRNKAEMQKLKQRGGVSEVKGWEAERYESMMVAHVDEVFERFVKRVGQHPRQVARYEFGGHPLPFHAQGKAYDKLWPKNASGSAVPATVVTGQAFASSTSSSSQRTFTTDRVPKCTRCGSSRVCEVQLMPNLINTLRPSMLKGGEEDLLDAASDAKDAESERRREIEEALGRRLPSNSKPDADGITRDPTDIKEQQTEPVEEEEKVGKRLQRRTGLRWNTAMVFVCQADCYEGQGQVKDAHTGAQCWSEEVVELQFENETL